MNSHKLLLAFEASFFYTINFLLVLTELNKKIFLI